MSNSFGQTSWAENVCVIGRLVHPGPKFLQDLLHRENLKLNPCQYHNIWISVSLTLAALEHPPSAHSGNLQPLLESFQPGCRVKGIKEVLDCIALGLQLAQE
jgi:hypothetical protein